MVRKLRPTNLFFQGPMSVGKTTGIFRLLRSTELSYGGFVVKRVFKNCRRVALDMVDLMTGNRDRLVTFDSSPKRDVNLACFLNVGIPAIQHARRNADIVVMDELGRFELAVPSFLEAVIEALDDQIPVIGVLKAVSNPFLDGIRARPDVHIVHISPENVEAARDEFCDVFWTQLMS